MVLKMSLPPSTVLEARLAAQAAIADGDLPGAVEVAGAAVQNGLQDPLLYNLVAYQLEEQGRLFEALAYLKRALELAPSDPQILHAVGLCLSKLGNQREALVAFDAALLHRPGFAPSLHHTGAALAAIGEDQAAQSFYERAVESDPGFADPLAGLAYLTARRGDAGAARGFAERALALDPDQSTALAALSIADLAEGRAEAAEARLRALLERSNVYRPDRPAMFALLGDALDKQGRRDDAFAAYSDGKATAAEVHGPVIAKTPDYQFVAQAVLKGLKGAKVWPETAPESSRSDAPSAHVFLLGFPRSGTTLAGQILAGHPSVVTLDERTPLEAQNDAYFFPEDSIQKLMAMGAGELADARAAYWAAIAAMKLDVSGKVLVDKLPLNTLKLPMIARLFPNAKILFAIRDPRDVVWSCFRQSFQINAGMAQFLALGQAARFYDTVMQVGEAAREALPLANHFIRYEALVEDIKTEMEAVCAFLDLDWREEMLDFAAGAAERRIATPSAPQVRRGLYTDAVGQWRPYASHLEPILPILQPWIQRFQYPDA
jgi:tetratricopeptide (TPR) repeat protein